MNRRKPNLIIYLDESYDQPEKRFMLLGMLFCPTRSLHSILTGIHERGRCLDKHNNLLETKYKNCFTRHNFEICSAFIDAFIKSDAWFCAIAVDTLETGFSLDFFGKIHEPKALKEARMYKKFSELLLSRNTKSISNAVLLIDEVTRCNHDRFLELIKESFCMRGGAYNAGKTLPTLKHVGSVKSDSPENIRLCLCDILLGSILNNNIPTRNRWKNKLRKHLVKTLGTKDLLVKTWAARTMSSVISRKFRIWYWSPENKKGSGA